jgi:MFS family permease
MDMRQAQRSIWIFICHRACRFLIFHYALVVPFYTYNSLSLAQISIIESVYLIYYTLIQYPSGKIVDKLGCKRALIIGTFLILLTDLMLFRARDFSDFFLVIMVDGLSQALCNNSDAIIISRILLSRSSLNNQRQLESLSWWLRNVALGLSSLAGGVIASFSNLYFPLLISMVAVLISLFWISLLPTFPTYPFRQNTSEKVAVPFFSVLTNRYYPLRDLMAWIFFYALDTIGYLVIPLMLHTFAASFWVYGLAFGLVIASSSLGHFSVSHAQEPARQYQRYSLLALLSNSLLLIAALLPTDAGVCAAMAGFVLYGWIKAWYYPFIKPLLINKLPTQHAATFFSAISFWSNVASALLMTLVLNISPTTTLLPGILFICLLSLMMWLLFIRYVHQNNEVSDAK